MAITFNEATSTSTFGDLFDDDVAGNTWYRLWTGDANGQNGSYVDTSFFNDAADGWIEVGDLAQLLPDYAQYDDTHLWIKPYSDAEGGGDWVWEEIDFTAIDDVTPTTSVSEDTPFGDMFTDLNTAPRGELRYQFWMGNEDGTEGAFADTDFGKGWVASADLDTELFSVPAEGESTELWVRSWTADDGGGDWEHWTVSYGGGDTTPPTLASTIPADDATDVAVDSDLVLIFSEDVQAGTGDFSIFKTDGTLFEDIPVSAATIAGDTVTLNMTEDLDPGNGYYVNVAPTVLQDLAGNNFAGITTPTTFNFTTAEPDDDRGTTYVGTDHSTYPYSAVTYIESTFPNGATYSGSGVVVGENDVLTASHLIYSQADGGLAEDIVVYPGRDGSAMPFGSYEGDLVNYFEVDQDGDGLLSRKDSENDLAVIGFDTVLGNDTGWFSLDPYASSGDYNLTGYPGIYRDSTGPRMTNDFGSVTEDSYHWVFNYNQIEVNSGNSGGPLWYSENGNAYVVGVVSTGGWAVNVYSHYDEITDWIDGNDYLLDGSSEIAMAATTHEAYGDTELEVMGVNNFQNDLLGETDVSV